MSRNRAAGAAPRLFLEPTRLQVQREADIGFVVLASAVVARGASVVAQRARRGVDRKGGAAHRADVRRRPAEQTYQAVRVELMAAR